MKPRDPNEEPRQDVQAADATDIKERIERALAPYKGLVPDEDLEWMRQMMELYANTHPDVATLLDGLRRRRGVNRSTSMTGPGLEPSRTDDVPDAMAGAKPSAARKAKPGRR